MFPKSTGNSFLKKISHLGSHDQSEKSHRSMLPSALDTAQSVSDTASTDEARAAHTSGVKGCTRERYLGSGCGDGAAKACVSIGRKELVFFSFFSFVR